MLSAPGSEEPSRGGDPPLEDDLGGSQTAPPHRQHCLGAEVLQRRPPGASHLLTFVRVQIGQIKGKVSSPLRSDAGIFKRCQFCEPVVSAVISDTHALSLCCRGPRCEKQHYKSFSGFFPGGWDVFLPETQATQMAPRAGGCSLATVSSHTALGTVQGNL